jgi:hypothetical protein
MTFLFFIFNCILALIVKNIQIIDLEEIIHA